VALACLALTCVLVRVSNASFVLPFCAMVLISDCFFRGQAPWTRESLRSLLGAGAVFAGATALGLLPWSILQHGSTGTFLYPLGHSFLTPGWTLGMQSARGWAQEATEFVSNLFYGRPISHYLPFALAGFVPLPGRAHHDTAAIALAGLIALAVLSHTSVALGAHHIARYASAFLASGALAVAASPHRTGIRTTLIAGALCLHLATGGVETCRRFGHYFESVYATLHERGTERARFDAPSADYRDLQQHIPPGEAAAYAVFEGFRFDFRRNPIYSLDVLGGAGPEPGWPAYKGPKALGDYLEANGVHYLVWVDFDLPSEFYNRAHWQTHLSKAGSYLQKEAPLLLDAEDMIEKLSAMHPVLYRTRGMTLVDLTSPR
jgi:hypothetical protein